MEGLPSLFWDIGPIVAQLGIQGAERPLRREVTTGGSADRKLADALDTPMGPHQFDHEALSSQSSNAGFTQCHLHHPKISIHGWPTMPEWGKIVSGCPHDPLHDRT